MESPQKNPAAQLEHLGFFLPQQKEASEQPNAQKHPGLCIHKLQAMKDLPTTFKSDSQEAPTINQQY